LRASVRYSKFHAARRIKNPFTRGKVIAFSHVAVPFCCGSLLTYNYTSMPTYMRSGSKMIN